MGRAMLSKSLIQFSVDGQNCVPSLFGLTPNYGRDNGGNGGLLQKDLSQDCCIQCPRPHGRQLSTHASARDSWTFTAKPSSVSCGITAPFSWVLMATKFCLCPSRMKSLFFLVLQDSCNQNQLAIKVRVPGVS